MNVFQAIVLGLVQGVTEFLPVSSSGHLLLFKRLFGIEEVNLFFDTMLHVGTLIAVVLVFWSDVAKLIRHPFQKMMGLLVVATIPAVVVTLLFNDFIEEAFEGAFLGYGFILTAILLVVGEVITGRKKGKKNISVGDSVIIGCMQAVAILPGISRSGSTLTGALFCDVDRSTGARFAFLMSFPAILGSVVYQGIDVIKSGTIGIDVLPVVLGTIAAAISGIFAVRFMLELIRRKRLFGFAIYVAILGVFVIVDQHLLHLIF